MKFEQGASGVHVEKESVVTQCRWLNSFGRFGESYCIVNVGRLTSWHSVASQKT
jgi:hypothetical protein